ncbi:MAG: hypothetical protein WA988_18695 [Candidatus Nanopelagicales bacterium]
MANDLSLVAHRIPVTDPDDPDGFTSMFRLQVDPESVRAEYFRIIDATFTVATFGFDDAAFHDGEPEIVERVSQSDAAVAAARRHLEQVVDQHALAAGHLNRVNRVLAGVPFSLYGGSCDDDPFIGYQGVRALSLLPALQPWHS